MTFNKGFSILEVVIAMGIITVGLLGVSSLALQNLQVETINKNYLVASMLAQEGMELVRNVRDTNFLKANDWKTGSGAGTDSDIVQGGIYRIDYNLDIQPVAGINDDSTRLFIGGSPEKYNHSGGVLTPYRRLIEVVDNGNYIQATSTVAWSERGRSYKYEVVTYLYNWW